MQEKSRIWHEIDSEDVIPKSFSNKLSFNNFYLFPYDHEVAELPEIMILDSSATD